MQSDYTETKFDSQPEGQHSFIYGSPADEEIRLRAQNHSRDELLSILGHGLRSAIGGVLAIAIMLDRCLNQDARKQKVDTSCEAGSSFTQRLCEYFIQRHGGRLTRESTLGKEHTFSFTIPVLLG